MTTVATRTRKISDLEGFDIEVTKDGKEIDRRKNGVLDGPYGFDKKAKGSMTVGEWKKGRFEKTYPGYSCNVLNANGTAARGNTTLKAVRASYEAA